MDLDLGAHESSRDLQPSFYLSDLLIYHDVFPLLQRELLVSTMDGMDLTKRHSQCRNASLAGSCIFVHFGSQKLRLEHKGADFTQLP